MKKSSGWNHNEMIWKTRQKYLPFKFIENIKLIWSSKLLINTLDCQWSNVLIELTEILKVEESYLTDSNWKGCYMFS